MLVVGCEGCEGVSVMMVGHGGVSVLVVGCEVGCAADLLLGLPVSIDILGLPLSCFIKSSSCVREGKCVREGPSLALKFSLKAAVLSCIDS